MLKNPNCHQFLDTQNPDVALEVLAFASFLLRKVDAAHLITSPTPCGAALAPLRADKSVVEGMGTPG